MVDTCSKIIVLMFVIIGIGLVIYGSCIIKNTTDITEKKDKITGGVFVGVGYLFAIGSGILFFMMNKNAPVADSFFNTTARF